MASHQAPLTESTSISKTTGSSRKQRLYQLVRQAQPIADRQFEIEFLDPGAEAFVFTFG
jgi:hypothetical protein